MSLIEQNKRLKKIKANQVVDTTITYTILLLVSLVFLFPCLWIVMSSFSSSGSIYDIDGFFPTSFSLDAFKNLFTDTKMYNYPKWFLNTLFIACLSCLLSTFLVILTAYCMSRFKFKFRKNIMKITLVLGMFPSFMGMTAVFLLMSQFNLVNSHLGLVLIYSCGAPMGYMVQKGFFDTIPNAIDEAARLDGATNFTIFLKIIMPLSAPIIVYTALMAFAWPWSDFILPKMLLTEKDLWTVAVGLMSLGDKEFARFAAGAVFVAVPIVILYFCLIKHMVNGMTAGAVK